jgi:hypothetical protein
LELQSLIADRCASVPAHRSDNGITNGIEVCDVRGPGRCILASNNDCMLRLYR